MKPAQSLNFEFFDCLPSTQTYLCEKIQIGADIPDIVVAKEQTRGRGRNGKSFYSPHSTGLYFSMAFQNDSVPTDALTPCFSIAVRDAVLKLWGLTLDVKWVNDLYYKDKKVCGILTQKKKDTLVVGIGVNVAKPGFVPEDLNGRMGWLFPEAPSNTDELPKRVYESACDAFNLGRDALLSRYREACFHIGREVVIEYDNKKIRGTCMGIDDDFKLLIQTPTGQMCFNSGYVSLLV